MVEFFFDSPDGWEFNLTFGVQIALLGIVYLWGSTKEKRDAKKHSEKAASALKEWLEKATPYPVNLRTCEMVRSSSYQENENELRYHEEAALTGLSDPEPEVQLVNSTRLKWTTDDPEIRGTYWSAVLYSDQQTLLWRIEQNPETHLYLEKGNKGRYYLDVRHLRPQQEAE